MTEPELVRAIREHPLVGRGSCTSVDECYDDRDLWAAFGPAAGNHTIEAALADVIGSEDLQMDKMLDQRWGEDSDVELRIAADWERRKTESEP